MGETPCTAMSHYGADLMCCCSAGDATAAWGQLCNSSLLLEVIDVSSNLQLNGEQIVTAAAAAAAAQRQHCLVDAQKTPARSCSRCLLAPALQDIWWNYYVIS